jgi:hypothetical protein
VCFDEELVLAGPPRRDLVSLDDAAEALVTLDARKSWVVEMRFFGGLSGEETAEVLGGSPRTGSGGSNDGTIRLWPTPEGRPLHALHSTSGWPSTAPLTNLRVVADPASATGHRVEPGPLPDWKEAPTW